MGAFFLFFVIFAVFIIPGTDGNIHQPLSQPRSMQDEIKTYHDLMAAIKKLQDEDMLQVIQNMPIQHQPRGFIDQPEDQRLCGRKMAEKIATLCTGTCTTGQDVASYMCFFGLTDAEVVQHCCPSSFRPAQPKSFVF